MKEKLIPVRLMRAREMLDLTLPEAAKLTGIDKAALWRYEQGEMSPSEASLRLLGLYLGVSTGYLTGQTEDPMPGIMLVSTDNKEKVTRMVSNFNKLGGNDQDLVISIIERFAQS